MLFHFFDCAVFEFVSFPGFFAESITVFIEIELSACFAHPADNAGRASDDKGEVRDIFGYDGPSSNKCKASNSVAANDCAVSAKGSTFPDQGFFVKFRADLGIFASGVCDVGENHGWATENVVFERYPFVYGYVVLELYEVPDDDIVPDVDILTENAVAADAGAALDVGKMPDFGAFADLDIVVDAGAFMNKIFFLFLEEDYELLGFSVFFQRLLAGLKDFENPEPAFSIGLGSISGDEAVKKMETFGFEGLGFFDFYGLSLFGMRDREAINPIDLVIEGKQFILRVYIVEHHHFFVADDDEFLLFVGMEPGDKDMGFGSGREIHIGDGDVGYIRVEIISSVAGDFIGHFIEEMEDDGYIVRGETPEDVFFRAEFA